MRASLGDLTLLASRTGLKILLSVHHVGAGAGGAPEAASRGSPLADLPAPTRSGAGDRRGPTRSEVGNCHAPTAPGRLCATTLMPGGGPRRLGAPAGRKSPRARAFFSVVCNTFDARGRPT